MKRVPRPAGTTYLSMQYNRSNLKQDKDNLVKHLTVQFVLQGFRFNKKPMDIHEFSQVVMSPVNEVMELLSESSESFGFALNPNDLEKTIKTIINLGLTYSLQDRGLIMNQVDILTKAQDNKYKPFISGEVNKALKLQLESTKGLQETFKTFFTQHNSITNILNVQDSNSEETISPQEALDMLNEYEDRKVHSIAEEDKQGDITGLSSKELKDLGKEYNVGEIEGWGFGISSSPNDPSVELDTIKPKSLKATTQEPKSPESSHLNPDKRRGHDYEEIDQIT